MRAGAPRAPRGRSGSGLRAALHARRSRQQLLRELQRRLPRPLRMARRQRSARAELAPVYECYVSQVSSPEMAVSLETACLLAVLCEALEPARVLDLGSGFSSYVLRRAAQRHAGRVVSVDDDARWLRRSGDFLREQGLAATGLFEWERFRASTERFELVFHDLGSMERRREVLPEVLERVAEGGVLVLDDVHKAEYAEAVRALLAGRPHRCLDLRALVQDRFGRHAWLLSELGAAA